MTDTDLQNLYNLRAAQLANRHKRTDARAAGTLTVLVFSVGKETYGIDIADLAEVRAFRGCTVMPDSPAPLLGLINVRGEIRPVFEASRILETGGEPGASGELIMVRAHGTMIGLRVDRIGHIQDINTNDVSWTKQESAEWTTRYVKGITSDTLRLIDVGNLTRSLVRSIQDPQKQEQPEWKAQCGAAATAGSL